MADGAAKKRKQQTSSDKESAREDCQCAFCKDNKPFQLPQHLIDQLLDGNVVLFAGAGISTENQKYAADTFYQRIAHELKLGTNHPFSELMRLYCAQPDGRIKLVRKFKERLDYFNSFSDFFRGMTKFHRSISPLYMLENVITTNWDDYFEKVCDFDAFVNDSDMALWSASKRRVMKIHGSIRNLGSIVATDEDYKKSFRRLNDGPMGALLKSLLTQNTFIYTGYSLSDSNYIKLAKIIAQMTRPHTRHSYYIAPSIDREKIERFPIPLIPIETDGAYFFEQLRLHLESVVHLIPESAFQACEATLSEVVEEHTRAVDAFVKTRHPLLVFALSYQDGLIHAFQRIRDRRNTGEYHCHDHVHDLVHGYLHKSMEYEQKRDFWNSSYADGYGNGLLYLLNAADNANPSEPPMYGYHGNTTFSSLSSLMRFAKKRIKRSYLSQANRIISPLANSSEALVLHHTPYL